MYATKQGDRGVLAAVSLDAGVRYVLPAQESGMCESLHGHHSYAKNLFTYQMFFYHPR